MIHMMPWKLYLHNRWCSSCETVTKDIRTLKPQYLGQYALMSCVRYFILVADQVFGQLTTFLSCRPRAHGSQDRTVDAPLNQVAL